MKGEAAPVFEDPYAPKTADARSATGPVTRRRKTLATPTPRQPMRGRSHLGDGDGDDTPPKPTGGKRVTSNPAAKKKRGGRKK
jgi:hypothetical protein